MDTRWKKMTKIANGLLLGIAALGMAGAAPAPAEEVVLYSSNPPALLDVIAQGFKEKTGHTMTSVRMGTGEAMKRIAAERAGNQKPSCRHGRKKRSLGRLQYPSYGIHGQYRPHS